MLVCSLLLIRERHLEHVAHFFHTADDTVNESKIFFISFLDSIFIDYFTWQDKKAWSFEKEIFYQFRKTKKVGWELTFKINMAE